MRNMATAVSILMLIISFGPATSWADDPMPPPWRGKARTTFQNWTFDDDDNPALPEDAANPWGDPLAYISVVEPIGAGWVDYLLGRSGIWGDLEEIELDIANIDDPLGRKEVWIQITYYHPPSDIPVVDIPGGVYLDATTIMLETYGYGSWFVGQQIWEMVPNPDSETVYITADPSWGMTIDQIVVDTACFPEKPFITDVARNAAGNVEITWTSSSSYTYSVEVSTSPYDYDEEIMTWVYQESGIPGGVTATTWEDTLTPTIPGLKFYRIYAEGPTDQKADDTVGMMVISLVSGRNMVSSPFEPYPEGGGTPGESTLDKIVGDQLTGHPVSQWASDQIHAWDADAQTYILAWLRAGQGWRAWDSMDNPPTFGLDADKGYWFIINNTPTNVAFFGRVSKTDREMEMKMNRNMAGTCFPVNCPLISSNLVESGFTGHDVSQWASDKLEFWDAAVQTYVGVWYRLGQGWRAWDSMDDPPAPPYDTIDPGEGWWVTVNNTPFTWTYPVPPR